MLKRAEDFYLKHGHLVPRKFAIETRSKRTDEERSDDKLARELDIVRRAKIQDVHQRHRRGGEATITW